MYKQIIDVEDIEKFRVNFVTKFIQTLPPSSELIDIGSGLMPYKKICLDSGINYISHDFDLYDGTGSFPGLRESNYVVPSHDVVCDITELEESNFDFALMTEVLEHVPDPVRALESSLRTLKQNGIMLITVPLRSHIHQAPYFFSSGLSPYFFLQHSSRLGYEIIELYIIGDQVDYLAREVPKLISSTGFWRLNWQHLCFKLIRRMSGLLRKHLSQEVLTSGGFSTFAIIKKTSI